MITCRFGLSAPKAQSSSARKRLARSIGVRSESVSFRIVAYSGSNVVGRFVCS